MTKLNVDTTKPENVDRELTISELDSAAGGCPGWLGPVAVSIAIGAGIRMGLDALRRLF